MKNTLVLQGIWAIFLLGPEKAWTTGFLQYEELLVNREKKHTSSKFIVRILDPFSVRSACTLESWDNFCALIGWLTWLPLIWKNRQGKCSWLKVIDIVLWLLIWAQLLRRVVRGDGETGKENFHRLRKTYPHLYTGNVKVGYVSRTISVNVDSPNLGFP